MSKQITESKDIDFKSANFASGFALALTEMLRQGAHTDQAEAALSGAGYSLEDFENAGIAQFDYDTLDQYKHKLWPDEFETPEEEHLSHRFSEKTKGIVITQEDKEFLSKVSKARLPPMQKWKMDFGFFSYEIKVNARTKSEARRKAIDKLNKVNVSRYINKKITYLEKQPS